MSFHHQSFKFYRCRQKSHFRSCLQQCCSDPLQTHLIKMVLFRYICFVKPYLLKKVSYFDLSLVCENVSLISKIGPFCCLQRCNPFLKTHPMALFEYLKYLTCYQNCFHPVRNQSHLVCGHLHRFHCLQHH